MAALNGDAAQNRKKGRRAQWGEEFCLSSHFNIEFFSNFVIVILFALCILLYELLAM